MSSAHQLDLRSSQFVIMMKMTGAMDRIKINNTHTDVLAMWACKESLAKIPKHCLVTPETDPQVRKGMLTMTTHSC